MKTVTRSVNDLPGSQTHIICLLDNSSSMARFRRDVVIGFNEFVAEQKKSHTGLVKLSLSLFNEKPETVYENVDIKDSIPLTVQQYKTGIGTAIYDTICQTIKTLKKKYCNQFDRPQENIKVIICLITDGLDSSSTTYKAKDAFTLIKEQSSLGWEFFLFGMTPSTEQIAEGLAIPIAHTHVFPKSHYGAKGVFSTMTNIINKRRSK